MPKFNFRERREFGDQFVQFLKDTGREAVSSREALRTIYNVEFRTRNDTKTPNFSSILFTLGQSGRAEVRGDFVRFGKVKKKVKFRDQYWTPRPEEPPTDNQQAGTDQPPRRGRAKERAEFIGGKHGVEILSEHDRGNGRIRFPVTPNEPATVSIWVQNNGAEEVTLLGYRALRKQREFTFHDESKVTRQQPRVLQPGDSYSIEARCLTQHYGYYPVTVLFEFTKEQDGPFSIGRFVSAVANSRLAEELGPTAPYRPYQANLRKTVTFITEDGVPPDSSQHPELKQLIPLGFYNYPKDLQDMVRITSGWHWPCRKSLAAELQFENYQEKFQLLLHLEELQMEVDIRRYDMQDVPMVKDTQNKRLLILEVPGVAENRPSVLRGDHLFVTRSEQRTLPQLVQYKGYVHAVELERVKLGFSPNLLASFVNNLKFDVIFTFNRLPLRVQHRAVELAKKRNLGDVLFPSFSYRESLLHEGGRLKLFDRNLETNQEQYDAVQQIVTGMSRPAPYIIFGPPGTGKTVTMVEAIKQVVTCIKDSHVLACAPSNSASDLLCQRLLKHLDKGSIYRINASSRDYRQVPEEIKPCCNWDDAQQCHVYPSKEKLQHYRVIITTLVTAGRLVTAQFPDGHFSHVFIDECGHAVEPECLVAIAGILTTMDRETNTNGGQLVLAGDPKQLGPILRSPLAIEHGLEVSLLERLMKHNSLYQKGAESYDPQFVTKLLRNYRSHAALLEIPNQEFYDGELQECADRLISYSYCTWEELPTQGFPIIFHGVSGEDQREGNSPSFFNTLEVEALVTYLKKLLQSQGKRGRSRISPKEIGIISPYRKQVEKIRQAITKKDGDLMKLPDIKELKVGSVEEFQGQERRVLLISTVRSCTEYLSMDEDFKLGFLKNPKRFNVAITRAKALLIIVGNPTVLSKDPHWNTFLRYCTAKGGYTGYPYAEESPEEDALLEELSSLRLSTQSAGNQLGESHIQQQVEPAWRHEH
ncbi:helicase MOV-10 [Terrapene carolina triunguis]|uniref:helicase MOV-10 n=1 Tax=Terrapene triunguis TaxID=2587831 RepID=UPI001156790F|nr:helicase MOV-10 [Terrapene carolina triunguis]